ncbi:MAG: DNA gyrase subunit A [Bacteroidales bacterium]|nr:DNA gyrase subunit A [Bacteroidales bacterium]
MAEGEQIIPVKIEEQMKQAYIDYSMSVIVARALPDARDGFKPVHRRILFGMSELGLTADKEFKKSARIVGDVLGKYHPHGDSSVYDAMVHMAQEWALRYPLVDGHGNFGSIDGDSAAAMRYTEARMKKIAEDLLIDIDKETVDMQKNFDESLDEPTVLPTRVPSLLINGSSGIAVGMATLMAPHNIKDAIDACVAYVENPDVDIEELIKVIKAPDFPTGATIVGYSGVRDAYLTGRGRIVLRSKYDIETIDGRECIVIKEIPYMVIKADMVSKIAEMATTKKIDGIVDVRDESNLDRGIRIVIEVRKDCIPNVVLNHLFKNTPLQSSFCVNNIAIVNGHPKVLNLKDIIKCFVDHRHNVIIRRSEFEKRKAEERAHILQGLIIASDNIDEVIHIIRSASSRDEARAKLIERFSLSDIQARAIVEMRLGQLTGLEQDKLRDEYKRTTDYIDYLTRLLASVPMQMDVIKQELIEVRDKYADERRTNIEYSDGEFNPEDFYADDDVVVTVSHMGYIKRTFLSEFKTQNRGGIGSRGSSTRDQDFIEHMYYARMHDTMMFFTSKGRCFWYKVYDIPEGNKVNKGRAIQNLLNIESDDKVRAFINVRGLADKEFTQSHFIIMATRNGIVKRTSLDEYSRPRTNGVIAITVRDGDELLKAVLTDGNQHLVLATSDGRALRFKEDLVRCVGRSGMGVKGINVGEGNTTVGFVNVEPNDDKDIFVLSERGFGKRSKLDEYSIQGRGCKGIRTIKISDKTGNLVAIDTITDEDDLMIINRSGITIRIKATDIKVTGRATQGLCLINLSKKSDQIASGTIVPHVDEDEPQDDEAEIVEDVNAQSESNNNENNPQD